MPVQEETPSVAGDIEGMYRMQFAAPSGLDFEDTVRESVQKRAVGVFCRTMLRDEASVRGRWSGLADADTE